MSATAILVLGPLAGVSAAFMTFSIGFYVSGQVLAGILGSVVTLPYGPQGKHGGNYIQTMAASVGGMCAMVMLVQARIWLGLPPIPAWELAVYFVCIGMFGCGLGMLVTPIAVDRMQLAFPSGLAVANILRALTDPALLKRSVAKLGGGMAAGYAVGFASLKWAAIETMGVSASTFGAGMIVGVRLAVPALVVALIGAWQTPHLVQIGWLPAGAPYRKIGFLISLGGIVGAAAVDLVLIAVQAVRALRRPSRAAAAVPMEDWKRVNWLRLILWTVFWGAATLGFGVLRLHQPAVWLGIALLLACLFVLVNGIAMGISDFNPITSAFVVTVFILAACGLRDPGTGLMAAAVVLIAVAEGGDMLQDRSTGWRLGTNRVLQFRYQVIGIAFGGVAAVVLAKIFTAAFPVLNADQFSHPHLPGTEHWQSAATYKLVGALRGITLRQPQMISAVQIGIGWGVAVEALRKLLKRSAGYQAFAGRSRRGRAVGFLLDAVVLPSPYAAALGGFINLQSVYWWTGGGVANWLFSSWDVRHRRRNGEGQSLPADMDTCSLVGGGLIAGDALSALTIGIAGLVRVLA